MLSSCSARRKTARTRVYLPLSSVGWPLTRFTLLHPRGRATRPDHVRGPALPTVAAVRPAPGAAPLGRPTATGQAAPLV